MRRRRNLLLFLPVVLLFVIACNLTEAIGSGGGEPPSVLINSPASGTEFEVGEEVPVQSTSTDDAGISQVELRVNGQVVRTDNPPDVETMGLFALVQPWTPDATGSFNIEVIAYDEDDNASEPSTISITVIEPEPEEETAEEEEPEPCVARSNTDLNVRGGPGTNYNIAGILQLGSTAPITGRDSGTTWWQIEFAGAPNSQGWVSAVYISTTGDCDQVEQAGAPAPPAGGGNTGGSGNQAATQHANETATADANATATANANATATANAEASATAAANAEPDLVVSNIEMDTTIDLDEDDEDTVTITVTVTNVGDADAEDDAEVVLYPLGGDSPLVNLGDVELDVGESASFEVDYTYTTAGSYTVRAVIDTNAEVDESDEGNNTRTLGITVNAYEDDDDDDGDSDGNTDGNTDGGTTDGPGDINSDGNSDGGTDGGINGPGDLAPPNPN